MAETERADLARVYRAIGNSKAPMPTGVAIQLANGLIQLRFAEDDMYAVRQWAAALGASVDHSDVTHSEGYDRPWHSFGTDGWPGTTPDLPGWRFGMWCSVNGPSPVAPVDVEPAVLGTGDEPADEAIVPAVDQARVVADAGDLAEQGVPDDAAFALDNEMHRWERVSSGEWRYYGIKSTDELVANYGPIRWYAANGRYLGTSGLDADDVPPNAGSAS